MKIYNQNLKSIKGGENKVRKLILITLLLFISVLLINNAEAAYNDVTIVSPITDEVILGTYNFSVTVDESNDIANITWAVSGTTFIASYINASLNDTSFSATYVTSGTTDALDYVINVSSYSDTEGTVIIASDSTTTGVDIDNTNPIASFILDKGFTRRSDPVGVAYDASGSTDATTGIANYTITLTKPDTTTVSKTTSIGTFVLGDIDSIGQYTVTVSVSDKGGLTHSATSQTFEIYSKGADDITIAATTSTQRVSNRNVILGGLMLLLFGIIVIVGIVVIKLKRK